MWLRRVLWHADPGTREIVSLDEDSLRHWDLSAASSPTVRCHGHRERSSLVLEMYLLLFPVRLPCILCHVLSCGPVPHSLFLTLACMGLALLP